MATNDRGQGTRRRAKRETQGRLRTAGKEERPANTGDDGNIERQAGEYVAEEVANNMTSAERFCSA